MVPTVATVHAAIRLAGHEPLPGKYTGVDVAVAGRVEALRPASKRLLFFRLVDENGGRWECIAKDRDGFLSAADVLAFSSALAVAAAGGGQVELSAFPECSDEGAVLCAQRDANPTAFRSGGRFSPAPFALTSEG